MTVSLRKKHPLDREIGTAILLGYFGVVVEVAAIASMFNMHEYNTAGTLIFALLFLIGGIIGLRRIRDRWR
jgi:hypothetical protein